jgi:methionyl-tRNA formyltransferase
VHHNIALYLMGQKGLRVLNAILGERGRNFISHVVTARDQNLLDDAFEAINEFCSAHQIPVYDKRSADVPSVTFSMAIAWRWLIPEKTGETLIVFHDSLLPRYRGFSPLVNSLINGEDHIGVTALLAASEYDRGPILTQKSVQITYPIKIARAIDLVSDCYVSAALEVVDMMVEERLHGYPQNEADATYSLWRDEDDYIVDWNQSAEYVKRFVDAVGYPYKGACVWVDGVSHRILDCECMPDVRIENRSPGKVIFVREGKPVVVCGEGLIQVEQLINDQTRESVLPIKRFRLRFDR